VSSTSVQKIFDHCDTPDKSENCDENRVRPRDRIIASAIELFRQHGYKGVGVDAIAEAAESNKMTLYRHFGSKDDLVCECLKQLSARGRQVWDELDRTYPNDPTGQLHGWVLQVVKCVFDDPRGCDLANAAVELKDANHPALTIIVDAKKDHRERLRNLCRAAGIEQYEQLANSLVLLVEGARVCGQSDASEGPQQQLKQTCEDMIAAFSRRPTQ
jgi:AcrR family transcriptional regulator